MKPSEANPHLNQANLDPLPANATEEQIAEALALAAIETDKP